jgi:type II secretory pathway component PulF
MLLGHHWIASLWRSGLVGDADAGLLQASERAGNLAWALRTTADTRERRLAYRLRMLLEFLSPLVLLLIALGVGFIVISLFMPLIKIVETLT